MLNQLSKSLGKNPRQIQEAIQAAMKMVGGVNQNNPDDVQRFLQSQGMTKNAVDKLLENPKVSTAIGLAKMARPFVPALQNVDIDGMVNKAREAVSYGVRSSSSEPGITYPSYDRRSDAYKRANLLPD